MLEITKLGADVGVSVKTAGRRVICVYLSVVHEIVRGEEYVVKRNGDGWRGPSTERICRACAIRLGVARDVASDAVV